MATLENLQGASLVANPGAQLNRGAQILGQLQTQQIQRQTAAADALRTQQINQLLGIGGTNTPQATVALAKQGQVVPGAAPTGTQQPGLGNQPPGTQAQPQAIPPAALNNAFGDPVKMAKLAVLAPDLFDGINANLQLITQQQKNEAADFAFKLRNTPFNQRGPLIDQREAFLTANNRSSQHTASLRGMAEEDQNQSLDLVGVAALTNKERVELSQGKGGLASAKTEILSDGSTIQALPDGIVQVRNPRGELVTGQAREAVLEASFQANLRLAQAKGDIQVDTAGRKTTVVGASARGQDLITRGLAAADSTAGIRRGIQLLDLIGTGGIDQARISIKQFFGVEAAEEGEMVNILGKAVLSQLRETFGAAFTAEEGKSLDRMEANMGRSPASNKRLLRNALRIAERTAKRGIDRAVEAKDFRTAQDIQDSLDFILEDTSPQLPVINGRQITEDDIATTMSENNMTREQVLQRLGGQ